MNYSTSVQAKNYKYIFISEVIRVPMLDLFYKYINMLAWPNGRFELIGSPLESLYYVTLKIV